ncbi:MAG: T9SS type A sorting domain-containing protein [Bacteroidetes bacterium]|nr:T9SS type A sorting domain-containing protein [Bacteroidota bacterium]
MMRRDTIWRTGVGLLGFLLFVMSPATAQPTVDGDLTDPQYTDIGTKQNSNDSFGGGTDVQKIVSYSDDVNDVLHIGIVGTMSTSNTNGIGLWLNILGPGAPDGRSAGDPLAVSGGGHYISGNGGANPNFSAAFDVDAMYAFNTGGGTSNIFVDAANVIGGSPSAGFVGSMDQSGTSATGTGPGGATITFATDNSGGTDTGIELAIPFAEFGASSDMFVQAFAVAVSSSAFFSDETVPGDFTGSGQPGFDASFDTFSGGPYFTTETQLPVELAAFDALADGRMAVLTWSTLSETNNDRFVIEHAAPGAGFAPAGSVEGNGTTTQRSAYRFTLADLEPGTHRFRLRQYDIDGASELSEAISLNIGVDGLTVSGAAPHPVKGESAVNISVERVSPVRVELFNLLGQRVRTLFDGTLTPGRVLDVEIDATQLPSGTYFLRTTADAGSDVQRVTIVR